MVFQMLRQNKKFIEKVGVEKVLSKIIHCNYCTTVTVTNRRFLLEKVRGSRSPVVNYCQYNGIQGKQVSAQV